MFAPHRLPVFTANYRVHDWDWGCNQPAGCLGGPIGHYPVTLVAMATTPGELLSIPHKRRRIYPGDFKALVLYAEETRITFTYTRRDTAAVGYLVHVEDVASTRGCWRSIDSLMPPDAVPCPPCATTNLSARQRALRSRLPPATPASSSTRAPARIGGWTISASAGQAAERRTRGNPAQLPAAAAVDRGSHAANRQGC